MDWHVCWHAAGICSGLMIDWRAMIAGWVIARCSRVGTSLAAAKTQSVLVQTGSSMTLTDEGGAEDGKNSGQLEHHLRMQVRPAAVDKNKHQRTLLSSR